MKTKIKNSEERAQFTGPAISGTGHSSEEATFTAQGSSRREFLQKVGRIAENSWGATCTV
jgi:hypothetical protein